MSPPTRRGMTAARFPLRIGEFAADLGLNPKTIRYYEEIGLLPPPSRSPSGYRQYRAADRERVRFIAKAKAIGFTLREIGEMLALRDGGAEPCPHVWTLIDRKLTAVETHLRLLTEIRADLRALQAEAAVTACSSTPICGLIERHERAPRS